MRAPLLALPPNQMTSLAKIIKAEIRKETEKAVQNAVRVFKAELKAERVRLRDIERKLKALSSKAKSAHAAASYSEGPQASSFQTSIVTDVRTKHDLSQSTLAKLVGVGLNTVWLWENGRTCPRMRQQALLEELLALSTLQMKRRLAKIGLKQGRNKPGRKPGSAAKSKKVGKKKVAKKKTTRRRTSRRAKTK